MSELDYQMALILQHKFEQESKTTSAHSSDHELALRLQEDFKKEQEISNPINDLVYESKKKKNVDLNSTKCLIDPSWEVIDPTPDIHNLFMAFNERFFWNKLLSVCVSWSKRMTSCAGICSYQGRSGMCSITLSEPLLKLRPRKDLVETLLHEMIHALLFVTNNNRDRDGHGPEFHKHMYRINNAAGTNISVYHDFHDEVRLYQQHWWKCDGPCQKRKPFFGMVRRAQNRAPGPNDRWWGEHSSTCGGTFIKVKEPEKSAKKLAAATKKPAAVLKKPGEDIRKFVTPSQYTSKSGDKENSKNKDNIKTLSNLNENTNSKITSVIPKSNNIFGFTNLDKPSTSKPVLSGSNNINGFNTGQIKGAVSNRSNTLVINKTNTRTKDNKSSTKTNNQPTIEESLSTSKNKNSSPVKTDDSDYAVVRNHWLSKFDNMKDSSNNKRSQPQTCTITKVPKLSTNTNVSIEINSSKKYPELASCPVCNKQIQMTKLDLHLDTCLEAGSNERDCIICNKNINISEYENHVIKCTNENFGDEDSVVLIEPKASGLPTDTKTCKYCDLKLPSNDYDEHVKDCFLAHKINTAETKKCPACEKSVSSQNYDTHVEKCLLKMYDEMESAFGINTDLNVNCLACDKKVLKSDLNAHLEDCMSMSNVFDDSNIPQIDESSDSDEKIRDIPNGEAKYNCPCCMKLILQKDMNKHIDKCLNLVDSEKDVNRKIFVESFEEDF
ncbi:unnamed protein product [Brassicogethes aeneus]|uniref:Protein with SprT-like domain at the N terminus n=1 Tax=Brassicogethes aeneus TaxID=1431903 RepID=A0A9P0AQ29_BRAAE|nr:unnamed protein product [Brassicogethes aeneus]